MKSTAALAILAAALLSGCATIQPNVSVLRVAHVGQSNVKGVSMEPLLGAGDYVVSVPYVGQQLNRGDVATFLRNDGKCIIHMVSDVRGDHVFFTGINNRRSDGWVHKSQILTVAQTVFTASR